MSRIYWDSMLFVYWLEDHPVFGDRVNRILTRMTERRDTLCTSVFTLGEVLVGPYKQNATEIASRVRETLRPPHVELLPFNAETADRFAQVRAANRVSPADAIHLACASHSGVDLFLTNDDKLPGLVIPGIDFIAGMDVNLF